MADETTSVATKDFDLADVVGSSVQEVAKTSTAINPAGAGFLLWNVAGISDGMTSWGAQPKKRDRELRLFWPTESYLSGAVATVCARDAAFQWRLEGDDLSVQRSHEVLVNSEYGKGWQHLMVKLALDIMTQDMGGFVQLIRDNNDDPMSPVKNVTHLDSWRCYPTGDPMAPYYYLDRRNRWHKMNWWSIRNVMELPAPVENMQVGVFFELQYCLDGDATVRMADGSTKRIREVVRNREGQSVMSIGPDGQMVPKHVTNWYRSPLGDRKLVNLRGEVVSIGRGRVRNAWVTDDHPVMTPDGWRPAGELRTGDSVVTEYRAPNDAQMEIIVGTLLGDASLRQRKTRPSLTFAHAPAQVEWAAAKCLGLAGLGATISQRTTVRVETGSQPSLRAVSDSFYPDGKKVLPRELVERHLSPRLLATWYLDDGGLINRKRVGPARPPHDGRGRQSTGVRPLASIGINRLSRDDAQWLAELLSTRMGVETHVVEGGNGTPRLLMTADGSDRLFRLIGSYVPATMRYKIAADSPEYDHGRWANTGPTIPFVDRIIVTPGRRNSKFVYCIDVADTANFSTAGLIVHNCAITRVLKAAQILRNIEISNDEKTAGRFMRAIHIVSGVGQTELQDAIDKHRTAADQAGLLRYLQPLIVPTLSPNASVSHEVIELASIPAGWDEEKSIKNYLMALAMGFLTDYQEFAPLPAGNIGTGAQSNVLHMKSAGKGPALWQGIITHLMNFCGILPQNVTFAFDEKDAKAEADDAMVKGLRATARATRISSGELDKEAARQVAVDDGDMDPEMAAAIDQRQQAADAQAAQQAQQVHETTQKLAEAKLNAPGNAPADGGSPAKVQPMGQGTEGSTTQPTKPTAATKSTPPPGRQKAEDASQQLVQDEFDAIFEIVTERLTAQRKDDVGEMGSPGMSHGPGGNMSFPGVTKDGKRKKRVIRQKVIRDDAGRIASVETEER